MKTLSDGQVTTKSLPIITSENTKFMNKHNMKDKVEGISKIKVHTVALTAHWELSPAVVKLTYAEAAKLRKAYFNLAKPF